MTAAPDLYALCELDDRSVLHAHAREVESWDDRLDALARRLRYLCSAAENAIGLAAPQVGESVAICALKLVRLGSFVLVNPKVVETSGLLVSDIEGCFSLPDKQVQVHRYSTVVVEYQVPGHRLETKTLALEGLGARAAQHEIDHLAGVLITHRSGQHLSVGQRESA